jgi:hypothetical protein
VVRTEIVTEATDTDGAAEVARFEAKARAELALADRHVKGRSLVAWSGDPMAAVALVKGGTGPAEVAGGPVLSGPDGDAAAKALGRLGYEGAVFATLSRRDFGTPLPGGAMRLREQLEAVEPDLVIALDSAAAADLAHAFGCAPLEPGRPVIVLGRILLALSGLEASLGDEHRKAVVWSELRSLLYPPHEDSRGALRHPGDQPLF